MRTTVRIDDDLLSDLKEVAEKEKLSLTKAFNKILRVGLNSQESPPARKRPFRQKTYSMGEPLFDYGKANKFAAQLEDEEILRKLKLGK